MVGASVCLAVGIAAPAVAATNAREVDYPALKHARDAEVFMEVRATPRQIAKVRDTIKQSDAVQRFAFLDKQDAFKVFSRIFRDEPKLVKNVDPSSLPTSFRVDLASPDDRIPFRQRLEALAGVDKVEITLTDDEKKRVLASQARNFICRGRVEAEVYMNVNATPAQEQAVADALAVIKGVDSVRRISHDEAKTIFDCLFVDEPDVVASAKPEELPVSFQLDLADGEAYVRVLHRISDMPGVDEIKHA